MFNLGATYYYQRRACTYKGRKTIFSTVKKMRDGFDVIKSELVHHFEITDGATLYISGGREDLIKSQLYGYRK